MRNVAKKRSSSNRPLNASFGAKKTHKVLWDVFGAWWFGWLLRNILTMHGRPRFPQEIVDLVVLVACTDNVHLSRVELRQAAVCAEVSRTFWVAARRIIFAMVLVGERSYETWYATPRQDYLGRVYKIAMNPHRSHTVEEIEKLFLADWRVAHFVEHLIITEPKGFYRIASVLEMCQAKLQRLTFATNDNYTADDMCRNVTETPFVREIGVNFTGIRESWSAEWVHALVHLAPACQVIRMLSGKILSSRGISAGGALRWPGVIIDNLGQSLKLGSRISPTRVQIRCRASSLRQVAQLLEDLMIVVFFKLEVTGTCLHSEGNKL